MSEKNGITIRNFIVKSKNKSINLKKVNGMEYHSDQYKGATEFHTGRKSIRIFMNHDDFQRVQEEYDKLNDE